MKKLLCLITLFVISCVSIFADTIAHVKDTCGNVIDSVQNIIHNLPPIPGSLTFEKYSWVLYVCAFAGLLARTIVSVIKGIANSKNGTPMTFDWSFFWKDNLLKKVATIFTLLVTIQSTLHLGDTVLSFSILSTVTFLIGIFYDWIMEYISKLQISARVKN